MIEHKELNGRPRSRSWAAGAITGELTRGILTAVGALVAVAIVVLLTSFVAAPYFRLTWPVSSDQS